MSTSDYPVRWSVLQKLAAAAITLCGAVFAVAVFYVHAQSNVSREDMGTTLAPVILDVRSLQTRMTEAERGLRVVQLREAVRKCARKNVKPSLRYDAEVAAVADFDDQLGTTNLEVDAYHHACGVHVP